MMTDNSPNGWVFGSIGECATVRSGFAFRSKDWQSQGVPVVKIANVKEGRLDLTGCSFVDPLIALEANDFRLAPGDVIIAMTGYIGDVALVRNDSHVVLNQRVGRFSITRPDKLDPLYLYYFLRAPETRAEIAGLGYGSAQPNISPSLIHAVQLPLPPLPVQQSIARVLGSLDDKIELNRRMNETLEATARAIFKSWFVDFDPVRAKSEGRAPAGLDPATAALFPDSFEDSELGEIPRGWLTCSFSETVDVLSGGTPSTSNPDYWNGDIPWFSVVDAPAPAQVFVIQTEKTITAEGVASSAAKVLPRFTTVLSARGTVGKCGLLGVPMAINQSCYGLIGADRGDYFTFFSTLAQVDTLQRHSHGSVFGTITRSTLDALRVVAVPAAVTKRFDDVVSGLMHRILVNVHESHTLAAIRDALLPRLLSGELSAEQVMRTQEAAQ